MTDAALTTESTVYVTYIAAAPERVWAALTDSRFTSQYFFGRAVESDWKTGSGWLLRRPDGTVDVRGEVHECDPAKKLVVSWRVEGSPELKNLPEAIVTYEIDDLGDGVVRLTMTEAHPTPIPAHLLAGGRKGWPMILSGLKSLLETGKPLPLATPQQPRKD